MTSLNTYKGIKAFVLAFEVSWKNILFLIKILNNKYYIALDPHLNLILYNNTYFYNTIDLYLAW